MKDAKGHGSAGRGAAMDRLAAARQNPNHPLGVLSRVVSQGTPIAGIPAAHQAGVADATDKGATMTRQHFEMIANTLAQHAQQVRANPHAHDALVSAFADKLGKTNPKFNKAMFVKAAGGH